MTSLYLLAVLAGAVALAVIFHLARHGSPFRPRSYVARIYETDLTTTIVVGPEAATPVDAELGALDRFESFCRMSKRSTNLDAAQIVTRRVS